MVFIAQIPTLPFIHFIIDKEGNAFAAWVVTALTLWSIIYYLAQIQAVICVDDPKKLSELINNAR